MATDFAQRLIAAHQAGLADKRSAEEQAFQKQIRDFQVAQLKHEQGRFKLQDQLDELALASQQNAAAKQQFEMLSGQPGRTIPDTTPDASGEATGGTRVLPHAPITFQGPNGPYQATPPTLQELLHSRNLAEKEAAFTKMQTEPQFADASGRIYNRFTGEAEAPKELPISSTFERDMTVDGKGPVPLFKITQNGQTKWLDMTGKPVTGQVGQYEKPDKPKDTGATDERSFQFNSQQLEKAGTPIADSIQRFSRLTDTLNQVTPQADALVAPELLTVMAGGQGSGLRMNEAEIARIVGGRTNLESLKAALNKWQTDPSKGLSITPAQREQIRSLVSTVGDKLLAKQAIIDEARQALVTATTPDQHRKIVADARTALSAIDTGKTATPGDLKSMSTDELLKRLVGK